MATELHALIEGFNAVYLIKDMITDILGCTVGIDAYLESKTFFTVISKDVNTTERRFITTCTRYGSRTQRASCIQLCGLQYRPTQQIQLPNNPY